LNGSIINYYYHKKRGAGDESKGIVEDFKKRKKE